MVWLFHCFVNNDISVNISIISLTDYSEIHILIYLPSHSAYGLKKSCRNMPEQNTATILWLTLCTVQRSNSPLNVKVAGPFSQP